MVYVRQAGLLGYPITKDDQEDEFNQFSISKEKLGLPPY